MAVGSTFVSDTGKTGWAYVDFCVDEGGVMGLVDYYAQTPLFNSDGTVKPATQLNSELVNDIEQQRANQGATATMNPDISTYVFFAS